jgi:hypothetical protein
MLTAAIILFIIGAIFGLVILSAVLGDRATPKPVVFTHGAFVVVALILVIIYTGMHGALSPITALVLFIIAALGGLTMFAIDMSKKPIPKWIAVVHPILAVIALIFLIVFVATVNRL